MGTKTIGLRDDAYERLKARKRDDESFTDLVDRLLDEATVDWREGFGTLDSEEMGDLERAVERSRTRTSEGLTTRQRTVLEELATIDEDPDEAA
ncbi:antitoxin VapB family protein [Halobellus sp. GM3]|uniref:antitoxin VapB family protein n=1 Tax=Halobellus sp. GM3 TaxID=3458410 RepID=UPI00403D6390